ncbi:hypothetical protein ARHIZOSPH14_09870 [Agromyces rhizosphaerae]|uniref:Uncharacterized protein n=1 Tax=Agromyces rhizosphaerae TaxID=88374 RepID=A0A9W6FNS9_9MICO|nr:hypothetical protein [Agromyces rhizosphaerae]GLI26745.1 hypothetical protein ARHIZOSPH14_09870 [Agromyces rhizosphaerae]
MHRSAFLAPIALSALLLAGCTGTASGASADQSTEEACGVLNTAGAELAEGMGIEDAFAEASADPTQAAERLEAFADTLAQTAQDEVGNAEVRDAALEFSTQVGAMADVLAAAADDPTAIDLDAFTTTVEEFGAASVAFEEICPA